MPIGGTVGYGSAPRPGSILGGSGAGTENPEAASPPPRRATEGGSTGSYYQNGTWQVDASGKRRFVPGRPGGQASSPAAPAPTTSPGTVNTAAADPNSEWLLEKLKGRFDTSNTGRAMDRAIGGIADSAALLGKDARAGLAARGALGSGVGAAFVQRNITDPAQRASAGAATEIALAEQDRLDRLSLGGGSVANAPGQSQQRSQRLALEQQSLEQQAAAQRQAAELAAQQAQQQQWMAMMQLTANI